MAKGLDLIADDEQRKQPRGVARPDRLLHGKRGGGGRRTWRIAWPPVVLGLLVVAQSATMFAFARNSYFFADDWLNFSLALQSGFTRSYLAAGDFGHFVPLHRAANYAVAHVIPLHFRLCLAIATIAYAGIVILLYRLLRLLCPPTWGHFVLLSLFGFSTFYAKTLQWWSASLNYVGSIFFSLICIDGFLRYQRTRRSWHLVVSVAALCIGALLYEKPILVPVYLVLLSALGPSRETSPRAVVRAVLREWPAWVAYLIPCALYVWNYRVHHYYDTTVHRPSVGQLLSFLRLAYVQFVLAYFNLLSLAQRPGWHGLVVAGSQLVVVGLIVASLVRNPLAWRSWMFFFVAFVANVAIVGWARIGIFGLSAAEDTRYTIENTFLFTLALGMAFSPRSDQVGDRVTDAASRLRRWTVGRSARIARPVMIGALITACVVHLGGFLMSATAISTSSDGRQVRAYTDNFRADLAMLQATESPVSFFDETVPFAMVSQAFTPYNRYSRVLTQLSPGIAFSKPGAAQHIVAQDGHILPTGLVSGTVFDPSHGTESLHVAGGTLTLRAGAVCMRAQATDPGMLVEFPLGTPLAAGPNFLEIGYRATIVVRTHFALLPQESSEYIDATGDLGVFSLLPDKEDYILPLQHSSVRAIRVDIAPGTELCITHLGVGTPAHAG